MSTCTVPKPGVRPTDIDTPGCNGTTGPKFSDGSCLGTNEIKLGEVFKVHFEDGTIRLMRPVNQKKRIDCVWLEVETEQLVVQTWLKLRGKKGTAHTRFRNPDLTHAFDGVWVSQIERVTLN